MSGSSDGAYAVDVDALADLAGEMRRFLTLAADGLHQAEQIRTAISEVWDGQAASAFHERHQQWQNAVEVMKEATAEFQAWAEESANVYRDVMAMNLRMAGG